MLTQADPSAVGALPGDGVPGDVAAGSAAPRSVAEALVLTETAMDYLNDPAIADLDVACLGDALQAMGRISGKFAAARAAILARFDAERGHDADGYGSAASWLVAKNKMTRKAASAQVRQMRQSREHPQIAAALASGAISEAWAAGMADWTRRLPADWRGDVDRILLDAAAAGSNFEDLAIIAQAAYEKWRSQQPDPDGPEDGSFDERYLKLGTTIDSAGRVSGDLTPECCAALQAVLESLGKKDGPDDGRTQAQRYHDALQLACELLIRSRMLPDRAGADTRIDAVISLAELLDLPGASELQEAWLAALTGEHGYLAGKDAETAACDALISPVVTGHLDLDVVDAMIDSVLAFLDEPDGQTDHPIGDETEDKTGDGDPSGICVDRQGQAATARSRTLPPEAWQALRYSIARLAVDLVSGADGIAAVLRRGLLAAPYNGKSIVLDVGFSSSIPPSVRRAVQLRAKGHCEWPGCQRRAAHCDVHHLRHKSNGGETSLKNCVLLCQFHHDICIHRRGWRLILHPDATTTAYSPGGRIVRSSARSGGHPAQGQPPGNGPPGT